MELRDISQKITQNLDVAKVIGDFLPLTKKGKDYVALCPFHNDKNASLSISQEKRIFKCFSCGESGNVVGFIMKKMQKSYKDAIIYLNNTYDLNIDLSTINKYQKKEQSFSEEHKRLFEVMDSINAFYSLQSAQNKLAQDYLEKRGLDADIQNQFNIGFVPEKGTKSFAKLEGISDLELMKTGIINEDSYDILKNRITFGIQNFAGKIVGFSGRVLDNTKPKYINSPETEIFKKSQTLYNFYNAKQEIDLKNEVIVCEGFMDVIALYREGIKNAVAIMGTSLTKGMLNLLPKSTKITLFLDADEAGQNAFQKSSLLALENGFEVKVIQNTYEKDADEILSKHGDQALIETVNNKKDVFDFIYNDLETKIVKDLNNSEFVLKFKKEITNYLKFASQEKINFFSSVFEKKYGLSLSIVKNVKPHHRDYDDFYGPNFEFQDQVPYYSEIEKKEITFEKTRKSHESKSIKVDAIPGLDPFSFLRSYLNQFLILLLKSPNFYNEYLSAKKNQDKIDSLVRRISNFSPYSEMQIEALESILNTYYKYEKTEISESEKTQILSEIESSIVNYANAISSNKRMKIRKLDDAFTLDHIQSMTEKKQTQEHRKSDAFSFYEKAYLKFDLSFILGKIETELNYASKDISSLLDPVVYDDQEFNIMLKRRINRTNNEIRIKKQKKEE
ncbi:DNA primase [Mycoplasma sp. Ms02]|uniref:DNA primase n=1 Tax=Mycoplasma sp. Ms02 TaxID=353851 RepID=UPI001C89F4B5|nr:DNA primase [Mycoplasma sp. Ms02]QZE12301.1 DNA primase [Mycoplasma sp. Ms02]